MHWTATLRVDVHLAASMKTHAVYAFLEAIPLNRPQETNIAAWRLFKEIDFNISVQ